MEITFDGGEADQHRLSLYAGAESLTGIGRALNIISHYVVTSEVRYKAPYSSDLEYYLIGTKDGSLSVVVSEISKLASQAQALAMKTRSSKLLRRVLRRATGQAEERSLTAEGITVSSGDIDALAEATTPGLLRAHRWINIPDKSIVISSEHDREITFNRTTRTYLEAEDISSVENVQDVSVGALNVNSRNGRVYFHDLGRTVPFWVPRDATSRTIPTLSRYLTQYAERTGATVNVRFRRVQYPDGRLKRIIISDCYAIAASR